MANQRFNRPKKEQEVVLPDMGLGFQAGLLKLCLNDEFFCAQFVRYLNDDDLTEYELFETSEYHFFFTKICDSIVKHKTRPSYETLEQDVHAFAEDERESYFKALAQIKSADIHNDQYYREWMKSFVTIVLLNKGLTQNKEIWKLTPMETPQHLQRMLDKVNRVHFEEESMVTLDDFYKIGKDTEDKIPSGLDRLDADMSGGLPRQTLVTVLGAANSGKSIFCSSLACNAIRKGYRVLVINLEGTEKDVLLRYVANLASVQFKTIAENKATEAESANIDKVIKQYREQLKIRHMLTFGVTMEEMIAFCREIYKDFKFDMLLVDYGQLLKTKDKNEKFDTQTQVFRALDTMSKEFNCVVVTPAQSTREGIKKQTDFVSRRQNEQTSLPVLRSGDLADCIEIARVSAIILTINRTEDEEKRGWYRLFLEKQRTGGKAFTYGVRARYDISNLIINDYYDPNSLVHRADMGDEDPPTKTDSLDSYTKPTTTASVGGKAEPASQPQVAQPKDVKPKAPMPEIARGSNPEQETQYNNLIAEYEKSKVDFVDTKREINRLLNADEISDSDNQKIAELQRQQKECEVKKNEIKTKARDLLKDVIPNHSKSLYDEVQRQISDLETDDVPVDIKTMQTLKQLELIYGPG